ncbi:MAG: type II secretion system protein M [Acidiferrobacteraceae bacterium]|jgi:general secretion pathway protein M
MKELLAKARNHWNRLSSRERGLLAAAGLFCAFALPYALLWLPMVHDLEKLRANVPLHEAQLAEMRKQAATGPRKASTQNPAGASETDLSTTIESSATALGMRDAIARMDTDSSRHVRLKLANAEFDTLAKWIWQMEHDLGIRVLSANITASKEPGRVDASLRIDH